jgi:hypothetical protein
VKFENGIKIYNIRLLILEILLGTEFIYGSHIRRMGHNTPHGPSAGWWVLTTANAAGINGLTYLPKHGRL